MSGEYELPDARFRDPTDDLDEQAGSPVPKTDGWRPGIPDNVWIPADAADPYYLRTETELWLVYLHEVYIVEGTARSLEAAGWGVVVDRREHRWDEDGEAAIVDVDLAKPEAEELLGDIKNQHTTQDALEELMTDDE